MSTQTSSSQTRENGGNATNALNIPGAELDGRVVRSVDISGNRAFSDSELTAALAHRPPGLIPLLRTYTYFDALALRVDARRIVAFYRERGYFSAVVKDMMANPKGNRGVSVRFVVEEGEPTRIAAVEFSGLPAELDAKVRRTAATAGLKRGEVFAHARYVALKQDVSTILQSASYTQARVTGQVQIDRDAYRARIALQVTPGPQGRFGEVRVSGNRRVPTDAVRSRIAWTAGQRFDQELLDRTRKRLLDLGMFRSVRLQHQPARAATPAQATALARPAAPVVPARGGDSPASYVATSTNPEEAEPVPSVMQAPPVQAVDVDIALAERPANELKVGAGLQIQNTRLASTGRISYRRQSLLDPLMIWNVHATPGYVILPSVGTDEKRAFTIDIVGQATRPDLAVPRLTATALAGFDRQVHEAYETLGPRVGLQLGYTAFGDRWRFAVSWRAAWLDLDLDDDVNIDTNDGTDDGVIEEDGVTIIGDARAESDSAYRLGAYSQSIAYDGRDSALIPRRGFYAQLQLEEGTPFAGGKFSYLKTTAEARSYLPLGGHVVLALRAKVGAITTEDTTDSPITERFYSGGPTSHRGFLSRQLAPSIVYESTDGNANVDKAIPVGGDGIVEVSAEVRVDIVKLLGQWLRFAVFADGGDVDIRVGDIGPSTLRWAVGPGLRYDTPLGPIRVDVGIRVDRNENGAIKLARPRWGQDFVLHFLVGESF